MKKRIVPKQSTVTAAMSVSDFLEWHEDPNNYRSHPEKFDAVYDILDKYNDVNDDVEVEYQAASAEDKEAITRIVEGARMTGSQLLKEILEEEGFNYVMKSTELKLTGLRTGRFVSLDIMRIPSHVIDTIADF